MKTLIALLLLVSPVWAFNEPDGFQKLKFGQDPKLLAPKCPKPLVINWEICWADDKTSTLGSAPALGIYNTKVGRAGLINGEAGLIDGRMESLTFEFASIFFTDLLTTFTEGYGEPTKVETKTVQNRAGATFTNRIAMWAGEKISIRLEERRFYADRGRLSYETPTWREHQAKTFKESAKRAVKDL